MADGAEGIHIYAMVKAFRVLGHDVRMVSPAVSGASQLSSKGRQLSIIKKMVRGPVYEALEMTYNIYGYHLLLSFMTYFKPHFIYDRYSLFNYSSIAAGHRFNIPVFVEVNAPLAFERDHEPDESLYFKKIAYSFETIICNQADRTVAVSTPLKNYLTSKGVAPEKIIVLPNGTNPEIFSPRPKSKILKEKLRISDSNIVIGFVGILRAWHGLDILLQAFRIVHDQIPQSILVLVGDGPIQSDIEKQATKLQLNSDIRITGRIPHCEVNNHIALFDIAVCARTTFYASPMKMMEYMAQKKPVVAPDTPNIRDIIDFESDLLLFKAESPDSLAAALLRLIMDEPLRNRIAEKGLHRVRNSLNWMANARRIIDEYTFLQGIGNSRDV